jgi:hypothetical protein
MNSHALIFDLESYAIDDAGDYLEPPTPPANYRDPAIIANWIEKANADAIAKAALDVDLGRIVCVGWSDGDGPAVVSLAQNDDEERALLVDFWRLVTVQPRPTLIGFNILQFDLLFMLRRSLYLGIKPPMLQVGKYRHDGIVDLMMLLSFDGALRYRGLQFYARRFGLDVPADPHSGADIAGLVAAGNWEAVRAHCAADVQTTVALARRTGVI